MNTILPTWINASFLASVIAVRAAGAGEQVKLPEVVVTSSQFGYAALARV